MTWQKESRVLSASLVLLLVQSCWSVPQNLAYYTHILPAQQLVQPQAALPQSSNLLLLPQGLAGLASSQQYAAAVPGRSPASGQYVVLLRQDASTEKPSATEKPDEGGWFNFGWPSFLPSLPSIPSVPSVPAIPGISGGDSSTSSPADKPENTPADNPKPAKLEELEPAMPSAAPAPDSVSAFPDQRFILGQPQYYGTYEGLKRLGIKNLNNKGVIPNFLLVRGGPGVHHLGGKPEPEKLKDFSSNNPGTAALAFQRYMEEQRQVASGAGQAAQEIQRYFGQQQLADSSRDLGSIVVNADRRGLVKDDAAGGEGDAEDVEATHPQSPSVAQVKPQAIALAGPGGVASSAPVGTALVGPGGLAVAAPAATAVAGPSGGAPPVVAPAQRILEAYLKRQGHKGYVTLTR